MLRTDGHRFRTLSPPSDETKALRGLVRTCDDLVERRVALAKQLRSLLGKFWAGAAEIFADVDSPIALDFLDRYPTPSRRPASVRSDWRRPSRAMRTAADAALPTCLCG